MRSRTLAFDRLEDRSMLDADPLTLDLSPVARATIEARSAQWDVVKTADTGNGVYPSETNQAGIQRHLWSETFYGWEGLAEFTMNLPEGAVIDGAVLRIMVTDKVDTMNRSPSLVAHLSTEEASGAITVGEYRNASGAGVGSVPFNAITPGQTIEMPLDTSSFPVNGSLSLVLRTSDQVAGQAPVADHNSRSVFTYAGLTLQVRYHVKATETTVDDVINDVVNEIDETFTIPDDVTTLIAEAVQMTESETAWKVPASGESTVAHMANGTEHLSVRGIDGTVRGVRTTVTPAYAPAIITAHVYRGNDAIAVMTVPAGGAFSYENEEGITDIVFVPSVRTVLTIGQTDVSVLEDGTVASTDRLTQFTSASFAIAAAPSVPMPTSLSAAVLTLNLQPGPGGNGEKYFYSPRDPSKYTLFRVEYTQGSGRIASVGTIMKTGIDYMGRETYSMSGFPDGYMLRIDDNTVAIAPGAPPYISFVGGFYKAKASLTIKEGATLESILPPAVMNATTVNSTMLQMDTQFHEEGIFPGVTEVRESSSPVFSSPGHQVNVRYQIRNEALQGGAVTFDVFAGWYAGEPERGTLQRSFPASLTGGQSIMLSVNVTAPVRPADATSDRPIISFITRFANGEKHVSSRLGKEPTSKDVRVFTKNENGTHTISFASQAYTSREQERIRSLTDKALNALLNSTDKRLVAVRDTLGEDHIVTLLAESAAAAMAAAEGHATTIAAEEGAILNQELLNAEIITTADGIGGNIDEASIWDPNALAQHLQIHSYDPTKNNLLPRLSTNEIQTLERTALGQFFLGIAQRSVEAQNDNELMNVATIIHNATGIATNKAIIFLRAANTPERRVDLLKQLFAPTTITQGDTLLRSIFSEQAVAPGTILGSSIALTEEHAVRIRFNFATQDQDFHHGNVYLMSIDGQQLSNEPLLNTNITNQFFADIPMINIARIARETFGLGGLEFLDDTRFRFKIALWDESNSPTGLQGNNVTDAIDLPQVISMNRPDCIPVGSYSTLPNTSEFARRRQIEDHALSAIKQNFPLDRSYTWLNTLGSGAHLGEKSAAIDLNIDTGGDSDEDLPIKVVADGTIDQIGLDYGSVKVRHVAEIHGEMRYWFTTYLHMRLVANGTAPNGQVQYEARDKDGNVIATLYKGQSLEANDVIGGICGRGLENNVRNDHTFKTHLHMEAEDDQGNLIHFGKLLADMGIRTYVLDDEIVPANMYVNGTIDVVWNDKIDEWVNETYNVIFDQEVSSTGHNNVWVAWAEDPTQRKRVIWVAQSDSGQIINAWLQFDDQSKVWNIHTRLWENL